ncbi:hypothetical protein GDO81_016970 [Engystomops pustulosus]|uniref:Uncharacterized protein n=1 Tax=Engystomops pustulosus TaxID=76066 RepID=A0AAV7AE39_ENGPU|nr:hypothetical protein GDO81_016970 [Engystomops pustulosus]
MQGNQSCSQVQRSSSSTIQAEDPLCILQKFSQAAMQTETQQEDLQENHHNTECQISVRQTAQPQPDSDLDHWVLSQDKRKTAMFVIKKCVKLNNG